jgi:hypothetical protein
LPDGCLMGFTAVHAPGGCVRGAWQVLRALSGPGRGPRIGTCERAGSTGPLRLPAYPHEPGTGNAYKLPCSVDVCPETPLLLRVGGGKGGVGERRGSFSLARAFFCHAGGGGRLDK